MATTQKGIYYPDDYTAVADVPEDMKDLAESVDTALGDLEDNIEQNIQPQIDDIKQEQTTQNNQIEALQTENTRFKATLPTTTGEGENITLDKTAELEFIQPPLPRGNSEQEGEPSPTNEVPITNVTGDVEVVVSNADDTETQTFTFPLGTQRMFLGDYLADDGIHHVRKQIELDGTVGGYNSTNNWYYLSLSSLGISILQRHVILSNYFKYSSTMQSNTTIEGIGLLDNLSYIILRNNNFSSSQDYKNFLSQNLPIVEYELATEEITPYTEPQQQSYDEIKQAISYEEQTNISGSSDESNPIFSVEAYQSIKLVLAG